MYIEPIVQFLLYVAFSTAMVGCIDLAIRLFDLVAYRYVIGVTDSQIVNNPKRRWYLVHALINTIIMVLVFPDTIKTLQDPINCIGVQQTVLPIYVVIGLHMFHIITSYKEMDMIDWGHHLISSILVPVVIITFTQGAVFNFAIFFMCGLPGGIDYYLLALNKYNIISRITEKYINVFLNMWIRLPGLLFACFCGFMHCMYAKKNMMSIPLGIFFIFSTLYNAIFFATRVVENYGEVRERFNLAEKDESDEDDETNIKPVQIADAVIKQE